MNEQSKIILVLVVIILILGIVFALKITGIIKPNINKETISPQLELKDTQIATEKSETTETKIEKKYEYDELDITNHAKSIMEAKTIREEERNKKITTMIIIVSVLFAIRIIIAIGRYKLYKKIGISKPLNIINAILGPGIEELLCVVNPVIILMLIYSRLYFQSTTIVIYIIIYLVLVVVKIKYYNIMGTINSTVWTIWIFSVLLSLVPVIKGLANIVFIITVVIVEIISAWKLAEAFDKNVGYKILAIIWPQILVVILGYQKIQISRKHELDTENFL